MTAPQIYTVCVFAFAAAVFCALQLRRACRTLRDAIADTRAAGTPAPAGLPPAAPDNLPGVNLADHDECALILHATNQHEAQLAAGCAALWDAVHEHRKEEGL